MTSTNSPIFPTVPTPPSQSFTQKLIEIDVTLAPDPKTNQPQTFADGSNTVTFRAPLRISARVQSAGAFAGTAAQVDVWGLTPSLMNQLSTLGLAFQLVSKNTLTIRAGDAVSGLATVFIGTVLYCAGDYNQAPNVPLHFECDTSQLAGVVPIPVSSFPQPTDVGTIMSGIAAQMNMGFENNGINIKLPAGYYAAGSGRDQYLQVAHDAGIQAEVVPGATNALVLAIWPKGKSRTQGAQASPPLVSPDTGLIGYPSYTAYGIMIRTIFNPQISFGAQIQVQSSLPKATGTWTITQLNHALDSLVPKGMWESTAWGYNPNYPLPTPPRTS